MDSGNAERRAAIAVRDAARQLASDATGDVAMEYRVLAARIDAALDDPRIDGRILALLGPTRRGESIVSMILAHPGADPVRTAKLLLRALEWDDDADSGENPAAHRRAAVTPMRHLRRKLGLDT